MARAILFDFKATTRNATRGFKRMGRGLSDLRRGYTRVKRASAVFARDLRQGNRSLLSSFFRLGGGVARLGVGIRGLVAGPLALLGGALGAVINIAQRVIGTLAKMTLGATALGIAIGTKALTSFATFEGTMIRIRAITGASTEEFARFEKAIEKVIRASEFSPKDIALAGLQLVEMGVITADAFETILPVVRTFATALGVDIPFAAETLVSTLSTFGMEVGQATEVLDIFTNASLDSNATARKLAVGMQTLGNMAAVTGGNIKDVVAILETLITKGIQPEMAAVATRNIFSTLNDPTPPAAATKVLKDLGLSMADVSLQGNSVLEILQKLKDAKITIPQVMDLFNVRSAFIAASMIEGIDKSKGLAKSIKQYRVQLDAVGRAQKLVADIALGLGQRFKVLAGSADGAFTSLGRVISDATGIGPIFEAASRSVNELADALNKVSGESVQGLFKGILDDFTSGRAVDALLDFGEALLAILIPMFEFIGDAIGAAFLKAFLFATGKFTKMMGFDLSGFLPKLVSFPDLPREKLKAGFDRAFEHLQRGAGRATGTAAGVAAILDDIQRPVGQSFPRRFFDFSRGELVREEGPMPQSFVPAPVQIFDNRSQNFYGAGRPGDEARSRARGFDPSTGKQE